jgi:hypothetical protein
MKALENIGCVSPIAIILYGVAGALFLFQYSGKVVNYVASAGWERVDGEIVSSRVMDEWDTTGDRFVPHVEYTYRVDGETFTGGQIDLRGDVFYGNEDAAALQLVDYPAGTAVTVYVNPADPARSVLTREVIPAVWWFTGVGLALLTLSVGLGIVYFGKRKSVPEPDAA